MPLRKLPDEARRSERARRAILTAARDLTLDQGYARLTIEGIAAAAGVGKQTIYRWWPSKGAIVFDAFLALSQDAAGNLELPDTGDIEADLRTVLRETILELLDPRHDAAFRALASEIQTDRKLADNLVQALLGPQMEATKRRLQSAQRAGQLARSLDLQLATELFYGPIFHRWLLRTAPLDPTLADALVPLVLRALRPKSAKSPPDPRERDGTR
ncbi:TetR/AcrR family transcriptional regulator [Chondromyces crocatus]|uniref:TetR family transcriptional regulator n=1 Tax=Chondromyces crocatus TaxID=52 RepID=A0A0K1ELL8_CHOCO|nr:TetR/AcrR family transcriptional regulator [Chondromyces crocatus]AKT41764.1 TetR family transcriptional regulator [Chondromyces crocatus]